MSAVSAVIWYTNGHHARVHTSLERRRKKEKYRCRYLVRRSPMRLSRAECLSVTLAAASLPLWPRASCAYDLQTAIAVAPIFQLSSAVEEVDVFLFGDLIEQRDPIGIKASQGTTARRLIRKLLDEGQARRVSREAATVAVHAQLLTKRQASEVESRAKEAEERLASILEFDAADGLKRDALNNELELMRPESLRFYHLALLAAQSELEAACRCFGDEERRAAAVFAKRSAVATSSGTNLAASLPAAERAARITNAIDKLPSSTGTALSRGDLQRKLDYDYVQQRRRQQNDEEWQRELVDLAKESGRIEAYPVQ